MKVGIPIYESGDHKWIAIARDPEKPSHLIDTIEYLILKGDRGAICDPGGIEVFPSIYAVCGRFLAPENLEFIFSSHQDPDVISSLSLWVTMNPGLKCYASWVWGGFIPHYGCGPDTMVLVNDEGMKLTLGGSLTLELVPAHYLHSSGNFHLYDQEAGILFTGDIGAALFPEGAEADLFVKDFSRHIPLMEGFHRRWMPSNEAKDAWIDRVAKLKPRMLCPQHGAIFQGEDVARFLQWLKDLKVGSAIKI